jgi:stage V sporulation protein B
VSITVLNLVTMRKCVSNTPAILKNMVRAALAAAIMGVCTYGAWYALTLLLGENSSRVMLCGLPIMVGVVVYALAAIKLKAITHADCLLLPKGDKLAKLLKL